MLSHLKALIPGAGGWPAFVRNRSQQYEGRVAQVQVLPSPSLWFTGMAGSRLPIAVAHGEGRADFQLAAGESLDAARIQRAGPAMRFVDGDGEPASRYPLNPNGSPGGLTAFTTPDGRATILMPHPERVFRHAQWSWLPADRRDRDHSPWMRIWHNARAAFGPVKR